MFGFLALGIFACLAFAGSEGGKSGGLLGSLLGGKTISDIVKDRTESHEAKEKEKKEAQDKKEQEVKDIVKKDKKDLTPRDIKRLKELQKDVDVEEFLTNKELKAFSDATGYTPKRDVSSVDDDYDLTPEEKQEELHELLKKKPDELTQKQKARLKKLASDPEIDHEDFSNTELKNYKIATGEDLSDTPKEDPKALAAADMELEQKKAITLAQRQYEEALKDPEKDENKKFIEAYDTFSSCAFDDDGNLCSPEEFEEAVNKLPDDKKKLLKDNIQSASENSDIKSEYNTQASKISKEEAEEGSKKAQEAHKQKIQANKNKDKIQKYADFKFEDGLDPADLDSDDPKKVELAKKQLEDAGLDVDVYKAVQDAKSGKNPDGSEPTIDDIASNEKVQKSVEEYNKRKKEGDNGGKKDGEPEPGKEGDKGGKKEGDDKDTNDDETEEETKNSEFEDGEPDDEAEGEEDKKKQNPHKVWKQKSYKRGDKTFKTKSYYNKKGASISKEEFQEKVKNYEKNNKKTAEESISDYLQDRLVLERFYPEDITMSKQFEGLDLAAFIKSRIEVED